MKRVLVLAAAIGLILPAAANAGTFRAVVIAKNAKRHALVTASPNGTVRTVRAPRAFRKIGLGAVVVVHAAKLPDGTFAASSTKQLRRAKKARVRATVVKRSGRKLYLSGGHSVFTLALRKGAGTRLHAGDRVSASASVGKAQLFCDDLTPVGHEDELELEGIYLSTDDDVLSIAVHGRGLVKVTIPDGFELPELDAGDQLWLLVTVEADGRFTLASIDNEDADGDSGEDDGVDMGDNWFSVTGVLKSLSAGSVAVEVERHPDLVRCAVPPKVDLSGFSVGQLVWMSCKFVDGRFMLSSLKSKTAELPSDGESTLELKGFISALDAYKVSVSAPMVTASASNGGGGQNVACALKPGQDLRGFAVGDFVAIMCRYSDSLGKYALKYLSSDHATLQYEDGLLKQWFELNGVISALASTSLAVVVAHHDQPVECSVPTGMDLRGFATGEAVSVACRNDGSGFFLKAISSEQASWPDEGQPEFTLDGILKSIRSDGVGVQVPGHAALVNCSSPAGTDYSGFAIGDTVELHCHFHDGAWRLATLTSEHAQLTVEP